MYGCNHPWWLSPDSHTPDNNLSLSNGAGFRIRVFPFKRAVGKLFQPHA